MGDITKFSLLKLKNFLTEEYQIVKQWKPLKDFFKESGTLILVEANVS